MGVATEPGMRLGEYQLLERIGTGAFSEVWKGMHVPTGRLVAVKFADKPPKALDHPNIVRLLESLDGAQVLELVEAPSLRSLIDKGPIPFEDAAALARGILAGLAHAHRQGIAHLDLKPENVVGDKLTDFESVEPPRPDDLRRSLDASRPSDRRVLGTLPYMAPEVRLGQAGPAADVYSFGVLFYEMLTGSLPIGAFPFPSEFFPEIPEAVDDILRRCLLPDPRSRFADAVELSAALEAAFDRPGRQALGIHGAHEVSTLRELAAFAIASPEQWRDLKELLASGELARWLRSMRRLDLALLAEKKSGDPDLDLERVLEATGHLHAPAVELDVPGGALDLGSIPRGERRTFEVRVIKRGRGYVAALPPQVDRELSETRVALHAVAEGEPGPRRETRKVGPCELVVRYTVEPRPATLEVSPIPLKTRDGSAELVLRNVGDLPGTIQIAADADWLHVSERADLAPGEQRVLPVVSKGPAGSYAEIELQVEGRHWTVPVMEEPVGSFGLNALASFMIGLIPIAGEAGLILAVLSMIERSKRKNTLARALSPGPLICGLVAQMFLLLLVLLFFAPGDRAR